MQNNNHTKFILTSILSILKESIIACRGIGVGIETQALSEYVMQTTFLKMTGALEQKMKCICWEIASNDYEYRYQYLKKNYGECSRYEDKNHVYNDLIKAIVRINGSFNWYSIFFDIDITPIVKESLKTKIDTAIANQKRKKGRELYADEINKLSDGMTHYYMRQNLTDKDRNVFAQKMILRNINGKIIELVKDSPLSIWEQQNFLFFKSNYNDIYSESFMSNKSLFDANLKEFYNEIVYKHRNRCAHNLKSYQDNLPTLSTIISDTYRYENYFFRFAIVILIDEIFIRLFNKYKAELINGII